MTTLREAAQQALDFCEFLWREVAMNDYAEEQREATEAALRAALAEQERGPGWCPIHQHYKPCEHNTVKQAQPTSEAGWLHRLDMEKSEAWMAGYAQGLKRAAEQAQPVAWLVKDEGLYWTEEAAIRRADQFAEPLDVVPLYTSPPAPQPLTIERLRDALVASRIIDPGAVEDPDDYDDGLTLHRIEALYRRLG